MPPPINKLIPVPREQLEVLLKEAGRQQTIQEFLSQEKIQTVIHTEHLYTKRARAAQWSRLWLLASALFSGVSFTSSHSMEDAIATILLAGMTILEFKVHTWFLQIDPRGPLWGYRNQSLFALLFLLWGGYYFFSPPSIKDVAGLGLGELGMGGFGETIQKMEQLFYAIVGIVGAVGQYILALYYRRAGRIK